MFSISIFLGNWVFSLNILQIDFLLLLIYNFPDFYWGQLLLPARLQPLLRIRYYLQPIGWSYTHVQTYYSEYWRWCRILALMFPSALDIDTARAGRAHVIRSGLVIHCLILHSSSRPFLLHTNRERAEIAIQWPGHYQEYGGREKRVWLQFASMHFL